MLQAFTEEAISTLREDINSTEMDQGKFIIVYHLVYHSKDFCASTLSTTCTPNFSCRVLLISHHFLEARKVRFRKKKLFQIHILKTTINRIGDKNLKILCRTGIFYLPINFANTFSVKILLLRNLK